MTAETSNARGDAEAKAVPVPTRVHLIGETAVIVGTPGRGWDEEGPEAHNCDAMGCATIGPHVLARVPFTDERALAAADCTCPHQDAREPDHDVACPARLDQQPAAVDGSDTQAAEIEALRAEVERLNRILGRIVEGDGGLTVGIRWGADAFAAAREYLLRDQEEGNG